MADPNIDWVPVSALLDAAAKELDVGQLVHTSVFSLFEAMSAVEVGNPKMDAGCRPQGDTTPLDQRPLQLNLTNHQLLGVMDHIMCCEATWHNGGALAKTVYSSLYMMQQERVSANVVLSAYCRGVEALSAEVNHLIMTGCVCEEEDFNAHVAGLPLEHMTTAAGAAATGMAPPSSSSSSNASSTNPSDKVLASISHAIDSQDLVLKKSQAGPENQAAASLAAAIVARLQFRKLILQGLIRLKRKQKPDMDQAAKLFVRAQGELAAVRSSLGLAVDHGLGWDGDLNSHLIPAVPPRVVQMYTPEKAVDYFESLLSQLLKVCHVTHVTGYHALKDYLINFAAEPKCPIARSAMHIQVSYNAWVPQQQQQQQQQAATAGSSSSSTYDEKHHQHHIQPAAPHTAASSSSTSTNLSAAAANGTAAANVHTAAAAAASSSLPSWVLSPRMLRAVLQLSPDEALGDDGELFLEQALIASSNMIQALLMNRSRCRRRLRRNLEDWGNLYQHALNADTSPQFQKYMDVHGWKWENEHPQDPAGPLATWVESETCSVMVNHLLMGFELSLYEPADYMMVYWYIELLCMVWQTSSSQLDQHRPAHLIAPSSSSSSSSKAANGLAGGKLPAKSSSKSGSKAAAAASVKTTEKPKRSPEVVLQGVILELWRQLCMGTLRLVMALSMLGMHQPPDLPFNSEAQRYDQRFASFHLLVRPDPLTYDQFKKSTSTEGVDVTQLLDLTVSSFKQALQAISVIKSQAAALSVGKHVLEEVPALERVAATNRVAAILLSRTAAVNGSDGSSGINQTAASAPQFKPVFEFAVHKWFPTVTLKSIPAAATSSS